MGNPKQLRCSHRTRRSHWNLFAVSSSSIEIATICCVTVALLPFVRTTTTLSASAFVSSSRTTTTTTTTILSFTRSSAKSQRLTIAVGDIFSRATTQLQRCRIKGAFVSEPWSAASSTRISASSSSFSSSFSSSSSERSGPKMMENEKTVAPDGGASITTSSQSLLLLSLVDQLLPTPSSTSPPFPPSTNGNQQPRIRLILASQSPRRREILEMMGLGGRFDAMPSPLDESLVQDRLKNQNNSTVATTTTATSIDPREYTRLLAEEKAHALAQWLISEQKLEEPATGTRITRATPPTLVLGSDTIVDLEGEILEKPVDANDAKETLGRLSGRTHYVHTGVAIYSVSSAQQQPHQQIGTENPPITATKVSSFVNTTSVTFATLQPKDILAYVATGEPMDKAGSYGIQGIGGQFVTRLEGDYFTVMGLPMHQVSLELSKAIEYLSLSLTTPSE
ncbi:hypothetical protein ACA910_010489 [Epithemia clementina (nom. ined.)]